MTALKLVKNDSNGFGTVDFGRILMPELATEQIESLLQVSGAFANGTSINSVQIVETRLVPESSSTSLFLLAMTTLFLFRRSTLP